MIRVRTKERDTAAEGHMEALNEGGRPWLGSRALSEQGLLVLNSLKRPCQRGQGVS